MQRILLFCMLAISLVACNRDVDIQRNGDGTATVSVSVSEADVNTVVQTALSAAANPLIRNPSVDLQNGQIVIAGEHESRNGSGTVSGTLTLTVSVVNGALQVQVTSANFEGWDVNDERIQRFNEALSERLGGRFLENNPNATLESISITNDNISVNIRVSR
jgi:hypothetical protein